LILAHTPPDEIDRRMMLDERCNHALLVDKQAPATILAATPACADHLAYPAPATFMQQWADVNPAAAWKAVAAPVLIVYGTSDFVSSIADDPYLAEMIDAFHPGTATVEAIDGMDHTMNKAPTMAASFAREGKPQFEPRIVTTVVEWLSKVRRP